jgi:formylglycine-generating enzyme required for sulfatase activity
VPDDRADLYNEAVDLLMLRGNRQIGADRALLDELGVPGLKLSDMREVLEELAYQVHEQSVRREGSADIGENRLVRTFSSLLGGSRDKACLVVDYIEQRGGLLVSVGEIGGEIRFQFSHRIFQEFLAACHLASLENFPAECTYLAWAAPEHWETVLPLAARMAKVERGASAADELVGGISVADFRETRQPNAEDWTCARLAGSMIQEIGLGAINTRSRTQVIAARVANWIAESLPVHPDEGGLPSVQRAKSGDVLAAIGDPRFYPQRFFLPSDESLGFVKIGADPEFRIGTQTKDVQRVSSIIGYPIREDETNDAPTPTGDFYIGRYPVTVAQFRNFIEVTSYQIGDLNALRDPSNRPVRWVTWYEALAYCEWLNEVLKTSSAMASLDLAERVRSGQWRVTLPSELEWEKASRGGHEGMVFPWGNDPDPNRANYAGSNIGNTSSVGCFPPNTFGIFDTIGNVWEWTRSLWGKVGKLDFPYPYHPDTSQRENLMAGSDVYRVVRGGSWFNGHDRARCAVRYRFLPEDRDYLVGFRVVLVSTHVS